ncbi:MAG: hypothetical protein ACXWUG_15405 [Polyangiales bacterium]
MRRTRASVWIARAVVLLAAAVLVRVLREVYFVRDVTPSVEGQLGVRYWEIVRTSFARGDGFPLWDRSQCGGWPFLANPDAPLLSGAIAGVLRIHGDVMSRWTITFEMLAGLLGTYLWGRRALELGRIASFFAGALFVSSGFVAFELTYRSHFLPFALIPWVLVLARLGERDLRAAIGAGAVLAIIVLEGGVLLPLGAALVALVVCELPQLLRRNGGLCRVLSSVGVTLVSFALFSAIKLIPTLVQLSRNPRRFKELDQMNWGQVATALGENELLRALGTAYHRDEYRAYVGVLAIGMAIAGAGTAIILKPRRFEATLLAIVALLLARGVFGPFAPYVLLSKLPLFQQINVPSRWLGLAGLGIAVCAAVAVDVAIKAVKRPVLISLVLVAAGLAVYDPLVAARKTSIVYPPDPFLPRPDPPAQPYKMTPGEDLGRRAEYPARNVGVANCYKLGLDYPEATGYVFGPVPQASVEGDAGKVSAQVHQDRYELDVDLRRPGIVRINQNFDPDFHASLGEARRGRTGLLEVALPAGASHVTVAYRPKGLLVGLCLSLLGVVGAVSALVFLGRRRSGAAAKK